MQNKTPAGFFVRLCAYIIDRAIFFCVFLIFRLISGITALIIGSGGPKAVIFGFTLMDIVSTVLVWVYFVFFTYANGATLGKYLMNIRVVCADDDRNPTFIEILIRETVGRFLCGILFIGYIMIGIDDKKRGLHDRICDTRVVYAEPKPVKVRESNDSYSHTGFYQSTTDTNDSDTPNYTGYKPESNDSYNMTERLDKNENEED